jgi:membrane fusion protein, adhesin transport system
MMNVNEPNKTRLLIRWLTREKDSVYKIYLLAFLQGALYISIPLTVQGIITYTMAGRFTASLFLLSFVTIIATLFIGILQLWQMRVNETLHEKIFCDVTDRITAYLGKHGAIDLRKKIAHFFEVVTLQKGIGKILLDFSFSIISIVLGLLFLPAYSSWFLFFSVVLGFAFYLVVAYYGRKASNANIDTSTQKYALFDALNANSNQPAQHDSSAIDSLLDSYLSHRKSFYHTFEKQYKGILIFKVLFVAILLFLGAYLVQIGELNIGQFVTSEIIVLLVINSVEKMVLSLGTFYDLITALHKIESIFKSEPNQSFLRSQNRYTLKSVGNIYKHKYSQRMKTTFYLLVISGLVILVMPWTQTVDMNGEVSALNPESRPQQITSRIAGRIERWYIRDGDFVKRNDTIAFISEIKEEYLDTLLVERSESQVKSKEISLRSYENKLHAIDEQIDALNHAARLKIMQVRNKLLQVRAKLSSDSMEASAAIQNLKVAEEQFKRYEELLHKGVISKTDLENRNVKLQEAMAKKISAENKIIGTKNELLNTELELNTTQQDYNEKLMKAESDKFSTMSMFYETEGALTKLQNQLSNYSLRRNYYYVLAPQDGYVNNLIVRGVGEIVKEGGVLCSIVPKQLEQAVELFIDPIDLPLINIGQRVQLIFDGWPAFAFTGWPGMSYGTYSARIVSYDKVISPNGKFRILAVNTYDRWPDAIQIGGGVKGFALLKDVPVVYELWRKANGFPPEFYQVNSATNSNETDKTKK